MPSTKQRIKPVKECSHDWNVLYTYQHSLYSAKRMRVEQCTVCNKIRDELVCYPPKPKEKENQGE